MTRQLILDANLLVLLVVGLTDKRLVRSHKRLSKYVEADFDLLQNVAETFQSILLTPHILTEASNLVRLSPGNLRDRFSETLARVIRATREETVQGVNAVQNRHYRRLGLTDVTLLSRLADGHEVALLTDDFDLYKAALDDGLNAHNFTHLQVEAGTLR